MQLRTLRQPILRGISSLLALLLVASATCGVAAAQADFEKGYQTYQSYHGSDFDTVNLANGNLVLNIPLISYEQRGGLAPVVISIRSNSTTFQPSPPYQNGPLDTKQHEVASGVIGAPWGQPHVSISPGGLSWKEERITTASKTATGPEYLTRFVAIDESGATHSLGGGIANRAAGNVPGIMYSVDGSGLMLQPGTSQTGPVLVDRNGSAGGLVDTNGNTVQLKGYCAKAGGSGDYFNPSLPTWEGYAHGTASATSIVDSIGRVIPNPSYLPPVGSYSCLVDLDASYHPANPDANGCETWKFPGQGGTQIPFLFCYAQISVNAQIPQPNGSQLEYPTINETWWVLTSVTLPNSTQWKFGYDTYGQVSEVTLPTGATVQYTYQTRIACGNPPGEIPVSGVPVWPFSNVMSSRMVASRKLTIPGNGNTASSTQTWTYTNLIGSGWGAGPPASNQPYAVVTPGGTNSGTVSVLDPLQNLTIHTFALQGAAAGSSAQGNSFCGPYETKTQYYQGPNPSPGAILKEVDTTYNSLGTDYANPTNFSNYIALDVLPAKKKTTLWGAGSSITSEEDTTYDNTPTTAFGSYQDFQGLTHQFSFGQLLSSSEYDWSATTPLRSSTHTKLWQSNWKYYAANLIDLPYQDTLCQSVCTAPNSQASQTTYVYDESAYSSAPGLGNPTSITRWLSGGTSPATHSYYSSASYGMPTQKQDAKGNITKFSYDSTGLYLNQISYPNSSSEFPTYDPGTGLLSQNVDVNGNTTRYTYDAMRRLTNVTYPDTGQESYCFIDLAGGQCPSTFGALPALPYPSFAFQKSINSILSLVEVGIADGLGRMVQKQLISDPSGTDFTDTTYDSLGRVQSVSNPYRLQGSTTTNGTTSYSYDALGRKLVQCNPDNGNTPVTVCTSGSSYQSWTYNENYGLNTIVFQDEAGNQWQHSSDAFGRLKQVIEPGSRTTTYGYNVLNDLMNVSQQGLSGETPRTRSFTYDSLSRLLTTQNPETGTICYGTWSGGSVGSGLCQNGYDLNGNVLTKTDARNIAVSYTYEPVNAGLDRLINRQSAGATGIAGFNYTYGYDTVNPPVANGKGHLLYTNGPVPEQYFYDSMGRMKEESIYLPSAPSTAATTSVLFDLAGDVTDLTYPDGRHIKQAWNSALQLTNVNLADIGGVVPNPAQTYFQSASYFPDGSPSQISLGNSVQQTVGKNNRLQVQSLTASSPLAPFNGNSFLANTYCYSSCTTGGIANNGNIWGITDTLASANTQGFTYDALNRISSFSLAGTVNQQYSIDSFGNMSGIVGGKIATTFDPATNRIKNLPCASSTTPFDAAGNQICDTSSTNGVRQYQFDADSRVSQIASLNTTTPFETYVYAADEARARKTSSTATFTEYVDFAGQPVAERDQTGAWTDYIYAEGKKIAKVSPALVLHSYGTCGTCSGGKSNFIVPGLDAHLGGYVIRSGDKLVFQQKQTNAYGGLYFYASDGSNSGGQLFDSAGDGISGSKVTDGQWHQRVIDLTVWAGKTFSTYNGAGTAMAGTATSNPNWDVQIADIALISSDGTVHTIFNAENLTGSPWSASAGSNFEIATITDPAAATHFYLDDHLGTAQLELSSQGYPVWRGQFAPFGAELDTLPTANHYKFTGKERDTESGLDYFGARYYASNMGRWMSPDWSAKEEPVPFAKLDDPQSLNLYDYARNVPTVAVDVDGHQCAQCHVSLGSAPSPNPPPKAVTGGGGTKFLLDGGVVQGVPGQHYTAQQRNWMGGCPLSSCHTFNGLFPPLRPLYITNVKTELPMLVLGASGMPIAQDDTALLSRHLNRAIELFDENGYTIRQSRALLRNPGLAEAFRGDQIDRYFKELVLTDPNLSHLQVTPRFKFGPDVYDPAGGRWWDVTTPKGWAAHEQKYTSYGTGTPLLTK